MSQSPDFRNRTRFPAFHSDALQKKLKIERTRKSIRDSIQWGSINAIILSILLFDLSNATYCPNLLTYVHWIEYFLLLVVTMNVIYHVIKIAVLTLSNDKITITTYQKDLIRARDSDSDFKITATPSPSLHRTHDTFSLSFTEGASSTPMNTSALSWRSNLTNDSVNYSLSAPSWSFHKVNSDLNQSAFSSSDQKSPNISYREMSSIECINDEEDLNNYLKEIETNNTFENLSSQHEQQSNLLSSFWSHPITKNAKDMSTFLKKCAYQLSVPSPNKSNASPTSPKGKPEDNSSPINSQPSALLVWNRLNVDLVQLTQWNENLRKWISQTILERLVNEFDRINESFEKQSMPDIKIGAVGLDRLRKTAQIMNVAHFIPSLSTLIPFLEISSNQEYLVRRIRELAKGGCMSDFKWNGGSSFNGKDWDESLPTDSGLIMHLFASYLDTQLLPTPNSPDTKPFTGVYYIKLKDKIPPLNENSLYIQHVAEKPPHYRVIVGETVYEMVKGYNNLFYTILFFIYNVNQKELGMLGRVNLGRAGINMLWIFEDSN